jgi:hypothetical protein
MKRVFGSLLILGIIVVGGAELAVAKKKGEKKPFQNFTADLSGVTGKTARQRNRAINAAIAENLPNLELTHVPQYSPFIPQGVAKRGHGTQIGKKSFTSRYKLVRTIVHEELHHRWWKRGKLNHHSRR